jgi:hypothetical protein
MNRSPSRPALKQELGISGGGDRHLPENSSGISVEEQRQSMVAGGNFVSVLGRRQYGQCQNDGMQTKDRKAMQSHWCLSLWST